MATIPIPDDPAERAATAARLIDEYGAGNVRTRSEPGVGVVYDVPDAEPKPEPKKAPAKKSAPAAKPAAAGAAAAD